MNATCYISQSSTPSPIQMDGLFHDWPVKTLLLTLEQHLLPALEDIPSPLSFLLCKQQEKKVSTWSPYSLFSLRSLLRNNYGLDVLWICTKIDPTRTPTLDPSHKVLNPLRTRPQGMWPPACFDSLFKPYKVPRIDVFFFLFQSHLSFITDCLSGRRSGGWEWYHWGTEERWRCVEECENTWAGKNVYPFGLVEVVVIRLSSNEPMVWKLWCQIYCTNVSFEVALFDAGLAYARFHLWVKSHFVHRQRLHPNYAHDAFINETFHWISVKLTSITHTYLVPYSFRLQEMWLRRQVWVDIIRFKEGMRTKVNGWRRCHFVIVFEVMDRINGKVEVWLVVG